VDDVEIKMALFLPRDAASVPVSRQVLDGCLETLGVTPDTRTDIALALGERAAMVPVSGTKALYGHPLGASGAIEAAMRR